ncbi:hypothetical protein KQX54_016922 [Cotesia glomerata]|uniref:Histone H4 n=1 Tax=Cotesia glomerata TaxID=32391 RepID=A0AAV7ICI8_COTGL|nr:hypothetical protein KQX54_016922 [Cotesia glomerata]
MTDRPEGPGKEKGQGKGGKGLGKGRKGLGKGGKGLGKGGVKRHRRPLRDNIQGITKPAIRRLARRGGVKRISGLVYEEIRDILQIFLKTVIQDAYHYTMHAKRNTVTSMDIVYALKRQGRMIYGFGAQTHEVLGTHVRRYGNYYNEAPNFAPSESCKRFIESVYSKSTAGTEVASKPVNKIATVTMDRTIDELKYVDFMALMERSDCEVLIAAEHQKIISEKIQGTCEAEKANRSLNRYAHAVCFDHSRVILPTERNRGNYINANYVDGFEHSKKFICGQAPTRHTCYDFYRMLWMEHVQIIVMLCRKKENDREKCHPYWSDVEQSSMRFGKFQVTTTSVTRLPHYVKSTIVLTDGTEATQTVTHYNFIAWPEHDVPKNTSEFLNFVLEVRQCQKELHAKSLQIGHQRSQPTPIVVHCNAGLGRTSCFCVVDISISRFDETQTVSIASIVSSIRQARFHSLFNPFQYLFCYKAVKMYIESASARVATRATPIRQAVSFLRNLVSTDWYNTLTAVDYADRVNIEKSIAALIDYIVGDVKSKSFDALKFDIKFYNSLGVEHVVDVDFLPADKRSKSPSLYLQDCHLNRNIKQNSLLLSISITLMLTK